MAAALLGIALWAYQGLRRTLHAQLEQSLRSSFQLQAFDLVDHQHVVVSQTPGDPDAFVRAINLLVVVRDSTGRIMQANSQLAREVPFDSASFRRALASEPTVRTAPWRRGEVVVVGGRAPPGGPPQAATLEVAASLAPLEAASRGVLGRMLAIALLGSVATLIGAGWLARSALAPVEAIANQAAAVQVATPGRRITVHADVEELGGLIRVLNAMLDRLERAAAWHRRILIDLGHDLRTPISTMRAEVEVALSGPRTTEQYRRALASTMEEIDRLGLIADALSLLGRLESGALTVTLRPGDLRSVAGQAVGRVRERLGGHAVQYEPPAHPVEAAVDAPLLGLALDQLLDNAMRHTPPGTRIQVTLAESDGRAEVAVEDEGPGVPDELLPRLFERFYRVDDARGREGGPGLGLTVVASIVEQHRGRVAAERGGRGGLRVRIDLPGGEDQAAGMRGSR